MSALFPSFFDSRNPASPPAKAAKCANFGSGTANFSNSSSFSRPPGQYAESRISNFSNYSRMAAQNPQSAGAGAGSIDESRSGAASWVARAVALEATGLPRVWAEPLSKLLCGPPPGDFEDAYWARVLAGGNRFADQWAAKAYALGWTAKEVFGLDDRKPAARHDMKGVAWLLTDAAHVVALDEHGADIMTKQASRLRFYRRSPGKFS